MERVIYNSRTKEFSTDDLSTKTVETISNGRKVKHNQGWENAIIFTVEEMKNIGKPPHYYIPMFVKLDDGNLERIASGFYEAALESDRKREAKQPWFGKVIPLEGKNGSIYRILDLETGEIVHEKEHSGSIYLYDKDYYEIYDKDWSAFDVIGAFDESVAYLKRNGITVLKSYGTIHAEYDQNGKFTGVRVGGKTISKEDLDTAYNKKVAALNLRKALQEAKDAGLDIEDIKREVKNTVANKDDLQR